MLGEDGALLTGGGLSGSNAGSAVKEVVLLGFDPLRRKEKLVFDLRLNPFVELFRLNETASPGRSFWSRLARRSLILGSVSDSSVSDTTAPLLG